LNRLRAGQGQADFAPRRFLRFLHEYPHDQPRQPEAVAYSAREIPLRLLSRAAMGLGGGPWQYFLFDPRLNFLSSNLEVECNLKIQPILRRCAEIPRQPHRSVDSDGPLAVDDCADPVHRNTQCARQFVQADPNLTEFIPK
jgi:hypothetical protein